MFLPYVDDPPESESGLLTAKTFEAGNLLMEQQMGEPVLQVKVGRLTAA